MNLDKLSTTARRLSVFFRVMQRILGISMIVILCVLAVLTIANHVNPSTVIGTELNVLDIGPITIELAEEHTPSNAAILRYAWAYAALGAAAAFGICLALAWVRRILAPMAQGQPFHPDTARYLKKLAWLSLALGVLYNIWQAVEAAVALRSFGLDKLMESGVIRSVTVNYTLEAGFLVIFFVLLLMSYLFSYGAELQKLSDETL